MEVGECDQIAIHSDLWEFLFTEQSAPDVGLRSPWKSFERSHRICWIQGVVFIDGQGDQSGASVRPVQFIEGLGESTILTELGLKHVCRMLSGFSGFWICRRNGYF